MSTWQVVLLSMEDWQSVFSSLLLVVDGSKYACSTADAAVRHRHLSVGWQRRNSKDREEEQCQTYTFMEPTELPRDVQGSTWCCSLFFPQSFPIVSQSIPFVPESSSRGDLLENQRQILSTSVALGFDSYEHELARSTCRWNSDTRWRLVALFSLRKLFRCLRKRLLSGLWATLPQIR